MKKIFSYIGIGLIVIGFLAPVGIIHGQQKTITIDPSNPVSVGIDPERLKVPAAPAVPLTPEQQDALTYAEAHSTKNPSLGGLLSNIALGPILWTLARLSYFIMQIMAFILGVTGWGLNFIMTNTIVNMSANISKMTGINIAWKVLRDLMNIAFIFILVYEAIKMIIGLGSVANIRKFLFGVVLASLLINFSLFFTKIIIDASNIATIGFYNSIVSDAAVQNNNGLSDAYMDSLKVGALFSTETYSTMTTAIGTAGNNGDRDMIIVTMMSSILFIITSFVFFAIGIMFIIRYITLLILLMLSPVGFMGLALPSMNARASEWWKTLIGQCLFAPIFMIMTWIILTLLKSPGFVTFTGGGDPRLWTNIYLARAAGTTTADSPIGLIIDFIVVIALVIASLTTAKKFASDGSKMVADATGHATAFAGGAILGTAAAGLRQSAGRGGAWLAKNETLKNRAEQGGLGGWTARRLQKNGEAIGSGSLDVRRSWLGEQGAKRTGVDLGKGSIFSDKHGVGGRMATQAAAKKEREENLDRIVKQFADKRNWAGLAKAVQAQSSLEKQQYMYKKLSNRDRVSFDKALGDPALTAKLREKLPVDDHIKIYSDTKDWNGLATYLTSTTPKAKTPDEQAYIYEKLSARDRVALDSELDKLGVPGTTAKTTMKAALSIKEREETEEAGKKAAKEEKRKAIVDTIEGLVSTPPRPVMMPGTTTPATLADLPTLLQGRDGLNPKDANKLSLDALSNVDVIKLLTVKHLQDIVANTEPFPDSIRDGIVAVITGTTVYPLQKEHVKYLSSSKTVEANWGI